MKVTSALVGAAIIAVLAATNPEADRYDAYLTGQFYSQIQNKIDAEMPQIESLLQQQDQTQAIYSLIVSAAGEVIGLGPVGLAQLLQGLQGGDVQHQAEQIRREVLDQVLTQLDDWEHYSTASTDYALFTVYHTDSGVPGPKFVDAEGRVCTQVTVGILDHFIPWSAVDCVRPPVTVSASVATTAHASDSTPTAETAVAHGRA